MCVFVKSRDKLSSFDGLRRWGGRFLWSGSFLGCAVFGVDSV